MAQTNKQQQQQQQQEKAEVMTTNTKEENEVTTTSSSFSSTADTMATSSRSNSNSSSSSPGDKSALTARIVSGSIGSLVTSFVVTPLEVVKVRLQATTTSNQGASSNNSVVPSNVRPCPRGCGTFVLYNGHMDCVLPKNAVSFFDPLTGKVKACLLPTTTSTTSTTTQVHHSTSTSSTGTIAMIRRIFAQEGLNGIYAGLRPTLVMAVPNTVLYFSAYEEIVWRLRQYHDKLNSHHHNNNNNNNSSTTTFMAATIPLWAGASARFVTSTVTAPFELLRTRQALATTNTINTNKSMWNEFQYIVQNEGGIGTLYKGLKPTLYRDVPFSAIYWLSIEHFRTLWKQRRRNNMQPPSPLEQGAQAFVNGAIAGMFAAACTTPFDVIKTRQQAFAEASAATTTTTTPAVAIMSACHHNGARVYEVSVTTAATTAATTTAAVEANTWKYLHHIAKTEGISALWSGNQTRMLKVAPSCAIMISSYELGKRMLESS